VFATQFYTLTGIHFLHVTAGAAMLAILLGFALRGRADEPGNGAMQPIGYYWHFVDVVWIVLYTVIYLVGA
jgi:cytochrome c oxidase subunit 3/cytochrome o ubiquinol oxidase subunit 3